MWDESCHYDASIPGKETASPRVRASLKGRQLISDNTGTGPQSSSSNDLLSSYAASQPAWSCPGSSQEESGFAKLLLLNCFSRVRLCDPTVCSLQDSYVHGMLQARILERVAMPSAGVSS